MFFRRNLRAWYSSDDSLDHEIVLCRPAMAEDGRLEATLIRGIQHGPYLSNDDLEIRMLL